MSSDDAGARDRAIELVAEYYAAFNRGDWDGMLALLHPEVVHDLNQGARETGVAAFSTFLQRMQASYREQLRDIVVMAAPDGRRAAAEYVVHGTYLRSDTGGGAELPPGRGQAYVLPGGAFFDIEHDPAATGRIRRVTNYYNLQAWIDQVAV